MTHKNIGKGKKSLPLGKGKKMNLSNGKESFRFIGKEILPRI